jgi:hypothetical protein
MTGDDATVGQAVIDDRQSDAEATRSRMVRALASIRREAYKAAVIEAVVYAATALLLANFAVTVTEVAVPARVPLPALGPLADLAIPGSAVVGAAVGAVVFVVALWLRLRRPLVERFEAVNPPVAEALRTARDAVDDGVDSRMTTRLYADVLDRLQSTSSVGLVPVRRVAVTLVLVVALSVLTTQAVVLDIGLGGGSAGDPGTTPDLGVQDYAGLQDGDAVLGDPEDVSAGDENLTARVESVGGDEAIDETEQFPATGGGAGSSGGLDSQQAGYESPELLEDAELIREYNLRIREEAD